MRATRESEGQCSMEREAVLLTGGKSSRMGTDKAALVVDGEALACRTARLLKSVVGLVTVLGGEPIPGCAFLQDVSPYQGPLAALLSFSPRARTVFLCACDMPFFDPKIVDALAERMTIHEPDAAVVPIVAGRLQPLCALYRASAFSLMKTVCAEGQLSLMAWLDSLWVETVDESQILATGIDPLSLTSVNTPEEFQRLLAQR